MTASTETAGAGNAFADQSSPVDGGAQSERALGEIIRDTRNLTAEQVEKVLELQRTRGLRFGEAAIALGYVNADDVLAALSQQFDYPYASAERRNASPELVALITPFSAQAESFRGLRSQMVMRNSAGGQARHAVAVISPNAQDGKSYIAANLAVTLAQLGGRTLLIDANLRAPRQHAVFGLDGSVGLSRILIGRPEGPVVQQVAGVHNLFVLPAGAPPPNPLELLERPAFALLMREMAGRFDHVVVDTAAAEFGSDAAVTAVRCGAAIMVARMNRSRLDALQALVSSLAGSAAEIVGVVTNDH